MLHLALQGLCATLLFSLTRLLRFPCLLLPAFLLPRSAFPVPMFRVDCLVGSRYNYPVEVSMNGHRDEPATKKDLDRLKQELIANLDANGKKIDQVEQKLTHRIDQVEQSLSAKIDANSATLSRVSHQVVENHEQIGRLLSISEKFKRILR